MTNLMKLSVIALLTGTLALVGCGDDAVNGTGGTGTGGTGATGGAGGAGGGAGGTGGQETCEQDCGLGNTVPDGASEAAAALTCSLEEAVGVAINVVFDINFAGLPTAALVEGEDTTYQLTIETIVSVSTVNLILNFADAANIEELFGDVNVLAGTMNPEPATIPLDGVPCTICFEADTANTIILSTVEATWLLDGGTTQELELTDLTIVLNVEGVGTLAISTVGMDPACFWGIEDAPEDPPLLTFEVPAP